MTRFEYRRLVVRNKCNAKNCSGVELDSKSRRDLRGKGQSRVGPDFPWLSMLTLYWLKAEITSAVLASVPGIGVPAGGATVLVGRAGMVEVDAGGGIVDTGGGVEVAGAPGLIYVVRKCNVGIKGRKTSRTSTASKSHSTWCTQRQRRKWCHRLCPGLQADPSRAKGCTHYIQHHHIAHREVGRHEQAMQQEEQRLQ